MQGMSSVSELHRLTKKDRDTIAKRLAHINPVIGDRGAKLYPTELALDLILNKNGSTSNEELAKNRKLEAEAEKAELQVARLRGSLVSIDEVKSAVAEVIKTLYQRAVRVTPQIAASKLVGLTDAIEIETIIRTELAAIFDELRTMPENFVSVEDAEENEETEDVSE